MTEEYQFDECKTCEKFPCYIEGLWQWNGVCMDYKPKKEAKENDVEAKII